MRYLIGPKLHEANWIDLQNDGYIARVKCMEVRCPMTTPFMELYLRSDTEGNLGRKLYSFNPNKFITCEYLIRRK